jgi:hypothetical protein
MVALVLAALAFHGLDEGMALGHTLHFIRPEAALTPDAFSSPAPPAAGTEPWRVFDPDSANPSNAMILGYENLYGEDSIPLDSFMKTMGALQASPQGRKKCFDLFNVRYLFVHSKQKSSIPGDTVRVYTNPHAFPRAWLVDRSRSLASGANLTQLWSDPSFDPRREVALAEDPGLPQDGPGASPSVAPAPGSVRWLARSPQSESLAVENPSTAVLVLANCWYPSWRCTIDGVARPVLKADGTLQAVVLGPGRHHVRLWFDDGLFWGASATAALAGLALAVLLGFHWVRRRPDTAIKFNP